MNKAYGHVVVLDKNPEDCPLNSQSKYSKLNFSRDVLEKESYHFNIGYLRRLNCNSPHDIINTTE